MNINYAVTIDKMHTQDEKALSGMKGIVVALDVRVTGVSDDGRMSSKIAHRVPVGAPNPDKFAPAADLNAETVLLWAKMALGPKLAKIKQAVEADIIQQGRENTKTIPAPK